MLIIRISQAYVSRPNPEKYVQGSASEFIQNASKTGIEKAGSSCGLLETAVKGFLDGLRLASTILGTILSIGTLALLIIEYTLLFSYLGYPLIPIFKYLGLPNADMTAPAGISGISEMYVPVLLIGSAEAPERFFICVLSISQLIFFSSVGPMILDIFKDIPVKFHELVVLFFIRTILLTRLYPL